MNDYLSYFCYTDYRDGNDANYRMGDRVYLFKESGEFPIVDADVTIVERPGYSWNGQIKEGLPVFQLDQKYAEMFGVDYWHIADTLDDGFNAVRVLAVDSLESEK